MTQGLVYTWNAEPREPARLHARADLRPLANLDVQPDGVARLQGRFVVVHNAGATNLPGIDSQARSEPIGDAVPDADGNFIFVPGRGGGRLDKTPLADPDFRWRYVQAAHFGEVNVYFHLDAIASYVDGLLLELGAPSIPRVTARVNAHHAATQVDANGRRDGLARGERWLPFQGGHYRLPGRAVEPAELDPVSPDGEIHLGPGRGLVEHGALPEFAGSRYRANASHNPGIIYHEYGHHITRHTADLSGNELRPIDRQDNRKTALDEGISDYWAATMLGTPHIWIFHQRHDAEVTHPRSLLSSKTMADCEGRPFADAHADGTIWAATLWDVRTAIARTQPAGARAADRLVLACLLRLGQLASGARAREARRQRSDFATAAGALLAADAALYEGRHASAIRSALQRRGIPLAGAALDPDRRAQWRSISPMAR